MQRKIWSDIGTALLAVVLAVIVWINATYQGDMPREDYFPELIPIHVLNAPSGLVPTNDPAQQIRARIRAFSSSWKTLTAGDFDAVADWQDLSEGVQPVPIKVTCSDPTVDLLSWYPSTVYVRLDRVKSELKEVTVEIQNRDEVPLGYRVYLPEVDPEFANVEGPATLVDRVAKLIVFVSLRDQRTTLEKVLEPIATDEEGETVEGVEVRPKNVSVRVIIEKKENYREVAVRARTKGQPARGYYISGIDIEPPTITVVGPPSVIDTMGGLVNIKDEVDIAGATRMVAEKVALDLPEEVSALDAEDSEISEVLVTVGIDAFTGGAPVELPLQVKKLQQGLVAKLSVPEIDVILEGPTVLLDELQTDLLEAYVDLGGLGVGTHQITPQVTILAAQDSPLRELVVKDISPKSVEVTISLPSSPTPTETSTLTPTSTLMPTIEIIVTPTMTGTATITSTLPITSVIPITGTIVIEGTSTPTLGPSEPTITPTETGSSQ